MHSRLKSSLLLTFLFFFVAIGGVHAQYGKKKKRKKRPDPKEEKVQSERLDQWEFKDRLWYGGGAALGLNGNANFSFFQFGLSPMVGYKFIEQWSAGPRIGFNYSYIKGIGSNGRTVSLQPVDFEFGAFTRFKFLPILFAHAEFTVINQENFFDDGTGRIFLDQDGEVFTERETKPNVYVGLGYNSDSELGYEFLILFNLLEDPDSTRLPISFRAGFNFRF